MIDYFDPKLALNEITGNVVPDAVASVYAVDDVAFATPLPITDMTDLPLANLVASPKGIYPAFKCPGYTQVLAKSGDVVTPITSLVGYVLAVVPDPAAAGDGQIITASGGTWSIGDRSTEGGPGAPSAAVWGGIGGTLTAQADLQDALKEKADRSELKTPGGVWLDSFPGLNDDAKLDAALAYCAAQTVKPHIMFSNRRYDFAVGGRTVFSGMKLVGLGGHGDQQRAANSIPNDIRFSGAGPFFKMPATGNVFDLFIGGLCFQGNENATFLEGSAAGVLWTSVIRDVGFNWWKNVLGSPAQQLLITAVLFDGWWNVNNSYDTAFHLGGSDNNLWMNGCLLDSGAITDPAKYHAIFDFLDKTTVGPMYVTGDPYSGIRILGSNSTTEGGLVLHGNGRVEGRNKDKPTSGACIRIEGGGVTIRDWSVNYGFAHPELTAGLAGHSNEGGLITIINGEVLLDGITYDRATGVAEKVPLIYQAGGDVVVRNVRRGKHGGAWTRVPRVTTVGGVMRADDTVIVNGGYGPEAERRKVGIYTQFSEETTHDALPAGAITMPGTHPTDRPYVTGTPTTAGVASGVAFDITIPKPAGLQDGDWLVAAIRGQHNTQATDFTVPSGWSRVGPAFVPNDSWGRIYGFFMKRIPTASAETATDYTFGGMTVRSRLAGMMFIVRGARAATPVVASSPDYLGTIATNGRTLGKITVPNEGCLQLTLCAQEVVAPATVADVPTVTPGFRQVGRGFSPAGGTQTMVVVHDRPNPIDDTIPFTLNWPNPVDVAAMSIVISA